MKLAVFTDFDGTITQQDTLEVLLDKYCTAPWREIEDQVTAGNLSENAALQREFDLLKIDMTAAIKEIMGIPIDRTFIQFAQFCSDQNIPLTILSGGIDHFIQQILKNHGLAHIPFFSNTAQIENGNWKIIPSATPRIKSRCNHCKTHHLVQYRNSGHQIVYIGDGNTDRCPAENADLIFAKGSLAKYLTERGINFYHFNLFSDIQNRLSNLLDANKMEAVINE